MKRNYIIFTQYKILFINKINNKDKYDYLLSISYMFVYSLVFITNSYLLLLIIIILLIYRITAELNNISYYIMCR